MLFSSAKQRKKGKTQSRSKLLNFVKIKVEYNHRDHTMKTHVSSQKQSKSFPYLLIDRY